MSYSSKHHTSTFEDFSNFYFDSLTLCGVTFLFKGIIERHISLPILPSFIFSVSWTEVTNLQLINNVYKNN